MTGTDPMGKAQALSRPQLPKRFYQTASVAIGDGGWSIELDGRPVRTPKRHPLSVPHRDLAEAIAAEWAEQTIVVDPAEMPLTRLANTAIDGVAQALEGVRRDLAKFAESDLLCYRAEEPEGLVRQQAAAWDPLLAWAKDELGLSFNLTAGVTHIAQPEATLERVRVLLEDFDAISLAGAHIMTTLTGSLVLMLAVARGEVTAEDAWSASLVDEDWQIGQWGEDAEAMRRRRRNWREMAAAARFLQHGRS